MSKKIMIWKRGIPLTKFKEKEMFISIPVPYQSTVTWGISEKLFSTKDPYLDEKKALLVQPVDYANYDNLPDFLYDNSILAINSFFKIGFTINGFKIKG